MPSPLGLDFNYLSSSKKWSVDAQSVGKYKVLKGRNVESLFKNAQFSPFPPIKEGGFNEKNGNPTQIRKAEELNGDEVNQISTTELISWTQGLGMQSMQLTYADFAYLKNLGVFPNNRLMIARRYATPVGNDLTQVKVSPMATLISWVPDALDFISITFGEKWEQADATFKDILDSIGEDMGKSFAGGTKIGSAGAGGFSVLSLPGFMEGIQYEVLKRMKLSDAGVGNSPLGNPNLIREAQRRTLIGKERAGSGLMCTVSVKFVVEYEQKFINGVDPTLVYLDIIQNALTFGTSDASFQFSSEFASGNKDFIAKLISGDVKAIAQAIENFVTHLIDAIKAVGQQIKKAMVSAAKTVGNVLSGEQNPGAAVDSFLNLLTGAAKSTIGHVVSKYKVQLLGVVNSLTGSPSAPWHVTIGNPKKPIFSSGDMICTSVVVTMGRILAFNDLPSSIKIEFTLSNARSLGAQEIFNRFNTGKARTYQRTTKSYVELPDVKRNQNTNTANANSLTPTVTANATTPSTTIPTGSVSQPNANMSTSNSQNQTTVKDATPNFSSEYLATGSGKDWFKADKVSTSNTSINVAEASRTDDGTGISTTPPADTTA